MCVKREYWTYDENYKTYFFPIICFGLSSFTCSFPETAIFSRVFQFTLCYIISCIQMYPRHWQWLLNMHINAELTLVVLILFSLYCFDVFLSLFIFYFDFLYFRHFEYIYIYCIVGGLPVTNGYDISGFLNKVVI